MVVTPPPPSVNIPRFYYPRGLPGPAPNHDVAIASVEAAFSEFEEEKADIYEMGKIAKVGNTLSYHTHTHTHPQVHNSHTHTRAYCPHTHTCLNYTHTDTHHHNAN